MPADDRIELRGLLLSGVVGVLDHERTQAQPLELDIDVATDLAAAGASDDLGDTVNYGELCTVAERVVTTSSFQLLEALADALAGALLEVDERIAAVTVSVRKLRPPVAQQLATSGVRITRGRP